MRCKRIVLPGHVACSPGYRYTPAADILKNPASPRRSRAPAAFLALLNRRSVDGALGRDIIRLPVQTVAAVLLAYACMQWLNLPDIAWGAFSALFVVRASVEGTIGEGTARVLGALIGVAIGVSLVVLSQVGGLAIWWSIVIGVGLAAYISMRWPTLSYSLVTVTILTVTPDADILAGAMHKTVAIMIGSASGILAAAAVLPLSARRSVRTSLAVSIEAFGDLLVQWAAALNDGSQRPCLHGRTAMEEARQRARDMSSQARTFPMDLLYPHGAAYRLHDGIDRLWRTVTLMERAGDVPLTDNICRRLGPALDEIAAAARAQVEDLAQALREDRRSAPPPRFGSPLRQLDGIIEAAMGDGGFDPTERESVEVIHWALHEVARELDALAEHLDGGSARR